MKIDRKEVLKRLSEQLKTDRGKVTLYLSKGLYEAFRRACEEVPASLVVEDLMRQFVESGRTSKRV